MNLSTDSGSTDAPLGGQWDRYLFIDDEEPEAVCLCGCRKFNRTGSHEQGDGTRRIYATCAGCQRHWIIVDERTETKFGKGVQRVWYFGNSEGDFPNREDT